MTEVGTVAPISGRNPSAAARAFEALLGHGHAAWAGWDVLLFFVALGGAALPMLTSKAVKR